jgi:hypothetical protein
VSKARAMVCDAATALALGAPGFFPWRAAWTHGIIVPQERHRNWGRLPRLGSLGHYS